jgi:hypothetical protein
MLTDINHISIKKICKQVPALRVYAISRIKRTRYIVFNRRNMTDWLASGLMT